MGENVPVEPECDLCQGIGCIYCSKPKSPHITDPEDLIFVTDTANAVIYFAYYPVQNIFKGNGERIDIKSMRQLHEWIGGRLI